ncbi:AbiJ-NTD4 domain-containing protein [Paludibacter jiangxiensis]|uniref:HEPN AbiJ-N-terminal domain-containing protein n=1 Tax=Paludibacter jiangxiensis TaxID=681398 RepID=A0A170YV38_9BACT|nr:hypothetical protein [Paludibacter jiangxiensis]GAT62089.1 hypothetical protein PJIAN_1679 [Paludibacter jiangxiensis]
MRFSQRIGKKDVRQVLQTDSIDQILENKLWNNILNDFINKIEDHAYSYQKSKRAEVFIYIWENFFELKSDEIPSYTDGDVYTEGMTEYIKKWFLNAEWYEKYDLIEFLSDLSNPLRLDFTTKVNYTLKRELAGYTIIQNKIIQITAEQEISAIENALKNGSKYKSVETHLSQALEHLSNRENPDYRNSIKESISAVEAYCAILTNDSKSTLGKALNQIEKTHKIHTALKSSFSALYGYTSDSGGIRHSLLEDDINVEIEDAKFMLVSCSAFINYLKSKE